MTGPSLRRFVVLHHDAAADGAHWDLMLEDGDALATWQVFAWPPGATAERACEIFRHRRRYLTYEGPLSRDRGTVRRVESGVYELIDRSADGWVVSLQGAALTGRYTLTRVAGSEWLLAPEKLKI